jgi:hypothetical protein
MDDDAHTVDNSAYELAAYLRVASIAVALYECVPAFFLSRSLSLQLPGNNAHSSTLL